MSTAAGATFLPTRASFSLAKIGFVLPNAPPARLDDPATPSAALSFAGASLAARRDRRRSRR